MIHSMSVDHRETHLTEAAVNAAEAVHQKHLHPSHQSTTDEMRRDEAKEHSSYQFITLSNNGAQQMKHVPFGKVAGCSPNGVPAYSNGSDTYFSGDKAMWSASAEDSSSKDFYTGFEWQCVEYARRWLFQHRGILLPDIQIAAHIIYLHKMLHVPTMEEIFVKPVFNGSFSPPTAGSLIVYPQSNENFVGHVGVITEATDTFVRVADQNRFFHDWGDATYSAEYVVERDAIGQYWIRDDVTAPVGWVTFPKAPRPQDASIGHATVAALHSVIERVSSPVPSSVVEGVLYAGVFPSLDASSKEGEDGDFWLHALPIPATLRAGTVLSGWTYFGYWGRSMVSFKGKAVFASTLIRILAFVSWRAINDKVRGKPTPPGHEQSDSPLKVPDTCASA